jgi:hypothetical protein
MYTLCIVITFTFCFRTFHQKDPIPARTTIHSLSGHASDNNYFGNEVARAAEALVNSLSLPDLQSQSYTPKIKEE